MGHVHMHVQFFLLQPRAGDRCVHRMFYEAGHEEIKMAENLKYSTKKAKL